MLKYRSFRGGVFTGSEDGREFILLGDTDARRDLDLSKSELAFFGADKLEEWNVPFEAVDTIPSTCQFVLATKPDEADSFMGRLLDKEPSVIATSFPRRLGRLAAEYGWCVEPYVVNGSTEAYTVLGRTDASFDLTDTKDTIRDNRLQIVEFFGQLVVYPCTNVGRKRNFEKAINKIGATMLSRAELAKSNPGFSYTTELLSDQNKRIKKYGQEVMELLQAVLRPDPDIEEVVNEAGDVWYSVQCLIAELGLTGTDVLQIDINRNEV